MLKPELLPGIGKVHGCKGSYLLRSRWLRRNSKIVAS